MMHMPHPVAASDAATPVPDYDPFSSVLHLIVAREIREISEKLEALADTLVADSHFNQTYLCELQTFDYVIQHANECASLLERIAAGEDSLEAVSHVGLGVVQDRLRAALGAP